MRSSSAAVRRDLPITRFTGQQHHLPFAALRFRPASQKQFEFFLASDKLGQAARMERVEAAFDGSRSQRRPRSHWSGDTLEVLGSKVLKLEQIVHELPSALSNDHAVRLRNALQASRKVRRLAYDG